MRKTLVAFAFSLPTLIVLASPDRAATLSPATGATNYNLTSGWVGCRKVLQCETTLEPADVVNLGAATNANTAGLQAAFNAQFPGFTYAFGGSLNITYNITTYQAFNTGKNGGANFVMDITNPNNIVLPANLHWVQWVNDNYNFTGLDGANLAAPKGIGNHENTIDGAYPQPYYGMPNQGKTFAGSPFYDIFGPGETPFPTSPPHFTDSPKRGEPTLAQPVITWDAELFLVSVNSAATTGNANNPPVVTFYDGVEWGWETTIRAPGGTPLPPTWTMMLAGLGALGLVLHRRERRVGAAA
jgi:hypothetical protein